MMFEAILNKIEITRVITSNCLRIMITRSVKNTVRPKSDTSAQTPVMSIAGVVSGHQYDTSVALQLASMCRGLPRSAGVISTLIKFKIVLNFIVHPFI